MAVTCKQHGRRWAWSPAAACIVRPRRLQGAELRAGVRECGSLRPTAACERTLRPQSDAVERCLRPTDSSAVNLRLP